jgi:hypothetical protein
LWSWILPVPNELRGYAKQPGSSNVSQLDLQGVGVLENQDVTSYQFTYLALRITNKGGETQSHKAHKSLKKRDFRAFPIRLRF